MMEETLEGGRGPPWAVEPLERERERESVITVFSVMVCFGFLHRVVLDITAFRKKLVASVFRSTKLFRRMPKPLTASFQNSILPNKPTFLCVTHNTSVNCASELCVVRVYLAMVLHMFPKG
jgi:hypothetical protein